MRKTLWILLIAPLLGCAAHKPMKGMTYTLESSESCPIHATLSGCDSSNPPKCARDTIRYRSGCEKIQAKP